MKSTLIFSLIIFIMLMGAASATTHFVAKTGSDSYNGTSWATAWATVAKVNSSTGSGDTVFFGTGTWWGTSLVPVSGTSGHPTVYACSLFTEKIAHIYGATNVTSSWAALGSNSYRATFTGAAPYVFYQDTLRLNARGDSAGVLSGAAGGYWYGSGRLIVKTYNWGSYNPTNYKMAPVIVTGSEDKNVLNMGDVHHTVFYGFELAYAGNRLIEAPMDHPMSENLFWRCNIHNAQGQGGQNPSLIYTGGTEYSNHNTVRACSLGYCWALNDNSHGNGITYYDNNYSVMESTTVYGYYSFSGYYHKNDNNTLDYGDSIRYNTFTCSSSENQLRLYNYLQNIYIYGNIFISSGESNRAIGICFSASNQSQNYKILNNTFYNKAYAVKHGVLTESGSSQIKNILFKYNVVYGSGTDVDWASGDCSGANGMVCDSNMYYTATYKNNGSSVSWTTWHGYGFDAHSTNSTNPGFNNPGANDFSRPSSSPEMNATYGGRTWTRFGAIQAYIPDTTPPTFGSISAGSITTSGATITWTTNEPATSQVNYGLTTGYGQNSALDQTLVTTHSVVISGLQPDIVYHFRVRSQDGSSNEGVSGDYQFRTLAPDITPPTFASISAVSITAGGATITWATNELATSQVNYGLTASYGFSSTLDPSLVATHSVAITGLQQDTVYHFRVRSRDGSGNEGVSGDYIFHTLVTDIVPPTFSNVSVSNISDHTATVTWDTNEPANTQLEYGLTTAYGSTTTLDPAMVTAHTANMNSLTADTLYHCRMRSRDAAGNLGISSDYTFRTLIGDTSPPAFSAVTATNITDHTAVVTWTTNEAATTQLDYGLTTAYGSSTALDPALVTAHIVNLANLTGDTLYHFRGRSRDATGNLGISGDYTFRTMPTLSLENASIGLRDSVSSTYDGYLQSNINDGVIAPRGGTATTWASGESSTSPHWVEMYFDTLRTISMVRIYWTWNSGRASWMCSQQYQIQYWDQGSNSYLTAATITNTTADSVTTTQFNPVSTRKIRYWQPANMGPPNYPRVIWLTELLLYGPNVPPAAIDDLGMLPFDTGLLDALQSPVVPDRQTQVNELCWVDLPKLFFNSD